MFDLYGPVRKARRNSADDHIRKINGPYAIGRVCRICGEKWITKKIRNPGRGWGYREGNRLRGKAIRHIRECHPEVK